MSRDWSRRPKISYLTFPTYVCGKKIRRILPDGSTDIQIEVVRCDACSVLNERGQWCNVGLGFDETVDGSYWELVDPIKVSEPEAPEKELDNYCHFELAFEETERKRQEIFNRLRKGFK